MNRKAANSRLWGLVKSLPGGEQTLRDLVAILHQEDGSGKGLLGTKEYCSTRLLTDGQFARLMRMVEEKSTRPKRRRCLDGNVVWLVSGGELRYVRYLARSLGWTKETLQEFISRQTHGRGVKRHQDASAVIEPMERMLRERGYRLTEEKGRKWWSKPSADDERFAPLRELSEEDREEVYEKAMQRSDEIRRGVDA